MDQGQTHNPNVTPRQLTNEMSGMVVPIVHTTQQNFLIGPFTKSGTFHSSRLTLWYLDQYLPSPDEISTIDTSYTYIFAEHLIFHM